MVGQENAVKVVQRAVVGNTTPSTSTGKETGKATGKATAKGSMAPLSSDVNLSCISELFSEVVIPIGGGMREVLTF